MSPTPLRLMFVLILSRLLVPAGAGADYAKDLRGAQQLLAAGEYAKAYQAYLQHAEDNPLAQFTLGMFSQLGWGRPVDLRVACDWHEKAAVGGIPASRHYLAECFRTGAGRPADPAAAARWYRAAADVGHHVSLCSLAELHMSGTGVERDPAKAVELCLQSAEQGSVGAQLVLAGFYQTGDASIRDAAAATHWYGLAAASGSPEAQYQLGVLCLGGEAPGTSAGEARHWFESAAAQGYLPAYFPTAKLYFDAPVDPETGKPAGTDLAKAYLWLAATAKRSADPLELERVGAMLAKVRVLLPPAWVPDLDAKVAAHLDAVQPQAGPR